MNFNKFLLIVIAFAQGWCADPAYRSVDDDEAEPPIYALISKLDESSWLRSYSKGLRLIDTALLDDSLGEAARMSLVHARRKRLYHILSLAQMEVELLEVQRDQLQKELAMRQKKMDRIDYVDRTIVQRTHTFQRPFCTNHQLYRLTQYVDCEDDVADLEGNIASRDDLRNLIAMLEERWAEWSLEYSQISDRIKLDREYGETLAELIPLVESELAH